MKHKLKLEKRRCANCNRLFRPSRPKQKYCTNECKQQAYRKRRAERDVDARMDAIIAQTYLGKLARSFRK